MVLHGGGSWYGIDQIKTLTRTTTWVIPRSFAADKNGIFYFSHLCMMGFFICFKGILRKLFHKESVQLTVLKCKNPALVINTILHLELKFGFQYSDLKTETTGSRCLRLAFVLIAKVEHWHHIWRNL